MKDKRTNTLAEVIDDYLRLAAQRIEIPLTITAAKEERDIQLSDRPSNILKKTEAEKIFKTYTQIQKLEESLVQANLEFDEVENTLIQFLKYIDDHKISYEKKDSKDKEKITYLFWLEEGIIRSNR